MFGIWDRMLKRWVILKQFDMSVPSKRAIPVFATFKEAEEVIEDHQGSGFWEIKEFNKEFKGD